MPTFHSLTGCIRQRRSISIVISAGGIIEYKALSNPVISAVKIYFYACSEITCCAFFDYKLRAGKHSYILCYVSLATLTKTDSKVVHYGENKVLGINGGVAEQTQLHRNGQALHVDTTIYSDNKSVGCLIVILGDGTTGNIEHAVCTNEGNLRSLDTNQGDANSHISVFCSTCLEGHRNFNILDIVLINREYAVRITFATSHTGSLITATERGNLEVLVYSTTVLNGNSTGAGDITPNVELCAIVYGYVTSIFHANKAKRTTCNTGVRCVCSHRTGNADCAVYGNVSATSHSQGSECLGSGWRSGRGRLGSTQSVCRIIRNKQGYACGNGVVTCRKFTVSSQHDGLAGCTCYSRERCIQSLIKRGIVNFKPCNITA